MPIDPIYLLFGAIFLGVFLLVEGIYYFFTDNFGRRGAANRRMRLLSSGKDAKKVFTQLRRTPEKQWNNLGPLGPALQAAEVLIIQSGSPVTMRRLLLCMVGLTIVTFISIIFLVLRIPTIPAGPSTLIVVAVASFAVGAGAPVLHLDFVKTRRTKHFSEQLPDALDMMVRSLRAGHPVSVAMRLAAEQMPDPIGTEIGIAVDEMTYGLELREALENVGDRVDVQDFQYVVVAISIQHETGGSLADVLGGLATVIRSRFRMFRKVRALSAEGRFSAKILGLLPFAFAGLTFSARPEYYLAVAGDILFLRVVGIAIVLQVLGMLIMRKMINFRV